MSNFIIKQSPARKIKHPSDDPNHAKSVAIGQRNLQTGKMKFESEAEKRDYEKRVRANDFNVMGRPAWYPAQQIRALSIADIPEPTEEDLQRMEAEKKRLEAIKDIDLPCPVCGITSHSVSPDQAFCHKCGRLRPDYAGQYLELIKVKE